MNKMNKTILITGVFYASKPKKLVGPVVVQGTIFSELNNSSTQDNTRAAIHRFIH
jgi:hypothetical protein